MPCVTCIRLRKGVEAGCECEDGRPSRSWPSRPPRHSREAAAEPTMMARRIPGPMNSPALEVAGQRTGERVARARGVDHFEEMCGGEEGRVAVEIKRPVLAPLDDERLRTATKNVFGRLADVVLTRELTSLFFVDDEDRDSLEHRGERFGLPLIQKFMVSAMTSSGLFHLLEHSSWSAGRMLPSRTYGVSTYDFGSFGQVGEHVEVRLEHDPTTRSGS